MEDVPEHDHDWRGLRSISQNGTWLTANGPKTQLPAPARGGHMFLYIKAPPFG